MEPVRLYIDLVRAAKPCILCCFSEARLSRECNLGELLGILEELPNYGAISINGTFHTSYSHGAVQGPMPSDAMLASEVLSVRVAILPNEVDFQITTSSRGDSVCAKFSAK